VIKIVIFGNYTYKKTLLHQLDSRSKLLFLVIFSLSVFLSHDKLALSFYALIAMFFTIISKLSIKEILKGVIPLIPFLFFSFLLQILFYGEGEVLYSIYIFEIYTEGLTVGISYIVKILTVLLVATIVTNCTKPTDLTEGLKFFLYPLKYLGIPVRDIAASISIAITFIPIIFDESTKIRNAQKIRGGKISILKFHIFILSIILPIIINTLERSDKIALAMELRGYNLNPNKIRFKNLSWTKEDTLLVLSSLLLLIPNLL